MKTDKLIKLLTIAARYDAMDTLFWNEELEFSVICNDIFWWGTADLEEITEETIDDFETALIDGGIAWGATLYCARMRKMRPQGAMYEHINKDVWYLFDACGPEREVDFGNPMERSEE